MMHVSTLAMLAIGLAAAQPATIRAIGDSRADPFVDPRAHPMPARSVEAAPDRPTLDEHAASHDLRQMAKWIGASGNNRDLPYMIVDKRKAQVFLFDARHVLLGTAPALLGVGRSDDSAVGIGRRRLATIAAIERTTAAGRFEASLGFDLEQDVLWIDYHSALSLHRVIVGNANDRRHERLASVTASDNRISYGCINVPASFYDKLVVPVFKDTIGIIYILPETKALGEVFAMNGGAPARHDLSSRTKR